MFEIVILLLEMLQHLKQQSHKVIYSSHLVELANAHLVELADADRLGTRGFGQIMSGGRLVQTYGLSPAILVLLAAFGG
jgi:hypothetical protein